MDLHTTILQKTKEMAAALMTQGADKPAPEDSFGVFSKKGDMIYLVGNTEGHKVDLDSDYKIQKIMLSNPRRIGEVVCYFNFPAEYQEDEKQFIESTAQNCPVALSLHPDLKKTMKFKYGV